MEKVQRFEEKAEQRDWLAEAENLKDVDQLRLLWAEASKQGAPPEVLEKVKAYATALTPPSVSERTVPSVPGGAKSKRSAAK
jgi:phage shock protein A